MSLNGIDSASGALIATAYDGYAISEAIVGTDEVLSENISDSEDFKDYTDAHNVFTDYISGEQSISTNVDDANGYAWRLMNNEDTVFSTNNPAVFPIEITIDAGVGNIFGINTYNIGGIYHTSLDRCFSAWTIEGSDNNLDWDILDTQSNISDWAGDYEIKLFDIGQRHEYRYIKLKVTADNGGGVWCQSCEWTFDERLLPDYDLLVTSHGIAENDMVKITKTDTSSHEFIVGAVTLEEEASNSQKNIVMTGTAHDGYEVTASEYWSDDYPWKPFGITNGQFWRIGEEMAVDDVIFLNWTAPTEFIISSYTMTRNWASQYPLDWTFEAWNDSEWEILETVVSHPWPSEAYTPTLSGIQTVPSRKYRWRFTAGEAHWALTDMLIWGKFETRTFDTTSVTQGEVPFIVEKVFVPELSFISLKNIQAKYEFTNISESNQYTLSEDITPIMTSNYAPKGLCSALGYISDSHRAFKAFDKDAATFWGDSASESWVQYRFVSAIKCVSFSLTAPSSFEECTPRNIILLGSNTGIFSGEESTIYSENNLTWVAGEEKLFTASSPDKYHYYRFILSNSEDGTQVYMSKIKFNEYVGEEDLLLSHNEIIDGDNLIIVKDDNSINPIVANNVINSHSDLTDDYVIELGDDNYSGFIVSAISEIQSPYYLFNNVFSTGWHSASGDVPYWIKIELPDAESVYKYNVCGQMGGGNDAYKLLQWIFQGSNNDSNWTDLDLVDVDQIYSDNTFNEYLISNPSIYKYYRFYITKTANNTYCHFPEAELFISTGYKSEMDTTSVTGGEAASRVYAVDAQLSFDDGAGYEEPVHDDDIYRYDNLGKNLVAHYLLNNNADDCHGIYDGAPTDIDFQGDKAILNGNTSDIYLNHTLIGSTDTSFTISCWVKTYSQKDARLVYGNDGTDNNYFYLSLYSDGYIKLKGNVANDITSSVPYSIDTLYNLIIVFDETSGAEFFIDGESVGTSSSDTGITHDMKIWLGADRTQAYELNGDMSNVRIYSDTKDQIFIDKLFAEGYYPKSLTEPTTTGLIAYYPLTGTAEDATGNYDGTEGNTYDYVYDTELGGCFRADGEGGHARLLPDTIFNDDYTLSFLFKASISEFSYLLYTYNNVTPWFNLAIEADNTITFRHRDDSNVENYDTSTFTITLEKWHNIVIIKTDTIVNIYIDNSLILTIGSTDGIYSANVNVPFPGKSSNIGSTQFDGKLSSPRFYNRVLTIQERTDIYNYEKNFRSIDIDNGLIAYYSLKNNSNDYYYNEYDATDDVGVTYDGSEATIPNGDNIIFPLAAGFVEAYYIEDGVFSTTTTEADLDNLTDCTLSEVRKYNRSLSEEEVSIIKFNIENTASLSLKTLRTYNSLAIASKSIETKVSLKSIDDKCTKVSAEIWGNA